MAVALAAMFLGRGVVPLLAMTGQASLSGHVGAVVGLGPKLRAAHDRMAPSRPPGAALHVLLPSENVQRGRVLDYANTSMHDGHLATPVELGRRVAKDLTVLHVSTLFDVLELALAPRPAPSPPDPRKSPYLWGSIRGH